MLCLPLILPASGAKADPEARLRRALSEMRLPFPASLDLTGFSVDPAQGQVRMTAVVRMTWAPGMRQRGFTARAADADTALAALLDGIRVGFSAAA
jgi:hypothetical protein